MTKPTILQTLLGRPSQTYTFPQDRDYHSTKAHMLRVASAAQKTSDLPEHQTIPTTVMGRKNRLSTTAEIVSVESHVIDSKLCLDGQLDDKDSGSEEDIFYTPDTSPMAPLVNQLDLPPNVDNDSAIATRTPFTPRSTTTSISSNSLDGHSIFSLDSSPLSDSTFITTPNVSDTGHDIDYVTKSARRSNPDRTKQPSLTYTDEDWAKDVRWLAPPSAKLSTKRKSKPSANNNTVASTSYYIAQLPPKIVPQPPLPRPRPRPKIRSKSVGITAHYSIMSSMTALLEEEDEDRESAHHPSQGSLRSAAAVAASPSERLRTHSTSSSARPRPSNSLRRQNNLSTKPLSRRKSRSLEHLPPITSARRLLPDSVHSLSSFASSTSYVPSIPSSGTPGYTSLTLPRAPQPAFTPNPSKRVSVVGGADGKIDLTRSGIAQTTMATVEVTKGLAGNMKSGVFGLGNLLNRARSRSVSAAKGSVTVSPLDELGTTASSRFRSGKAGVDAVLNFTSYRRPPDYIPGGGVLVQVWAVAVDGIDAKLAGVVHSRVEEGRNPRFNIPSQRTSEKEGTKNTSSSTRPSLFRSVSARKHKRSESDNNSLGRKSSVGVHSIDPDVGYIPGRSFVGRVLECGWDVSEDVVRKGEWVVGLLDVRKCGALQEFIVADRHRVHRIPHPTIPFVSPLADSVSEFSETPLPPTRGAKHSHRQASSSSASASHLSSHSRSNSSPSRASSLSRPGRPPNLNLDPPPLTLEEYALLPLCGIFAYRAVRTLAYAFGKPMPSSAEPGNFSPSPRRINEHEEGSRRRRALVLRGHDGVGAIAVQMLVKRGWRVCVHASFLRDPELVEEGSREERVYMESVERRVRRWGAEEVVFDDGGGSDPEGGGGGCEDGVAAVVRVIERLVEDGDVFDAVLDTVGGKEIWEASERLLRNTGVPSPSPDSIFPSISSSSEIKPSLLGRRKKKDKNNDASPLPGNQSHPGGTGQFTTLVGDTPSRPIPTASDHFRAGLRSMKNTHNATTTKDGSNRSPVKKGANGNGKVGYAWVSVAQDVDWEGEDIRDSLGAVVKMAMSEGVRPWIGGSKSEGNDEANDNDDDERVVPFERTPRIFVANGPLSNGGTAVVKVVE
ncbi:uncharacterized protein C8R40DRAFT_1264914 [Lentinula edodes]|uniref:uncharacterized protein n=1 Tax=Lentinula edodes TaxID=5353 RepID=UPI001E8E3E22|nr:uncharacterized protein C8R40DRAFT_1264914 [Lentinula edodes]KAH7875952.1 hypothetical protein C8R40DRAFT_1264914 [Lentinula edodes]